MMLSCRLLLMAIRVAFLVQMIKLTRMELLLAVTAANGATSGASDKDLSTTQAVIGRR